VRTCDRRAACIIKAGCFHTLSCVVTIAMWDVPMQHGLNDGKELRVVMAKKFDGLSGAQQARHSLLILVMS